LACPDHGQPSSRLVWKATEPRMQQNPEQRCLHAHGTPIGEIIRKAETAAQLQPDLFWKIPRGPAHFARIELFYILPHRGYARSGRDFHPLRVANQSTRYGHSAATRRHSSPFCIMRMDAAFTARFPNINALRFVRIVQIIRVPRGLRVPLIRGTIAAFPQYDLHKAGGFPKRGEFVPAIGERDRLLAYVNFVRNDRGRLRTSGSFGRPPPTSQSVAWAAPVTVIARPQPCLVHHRRATRRGAHGGPLAMNGFPSKCDGLHLLLPPLCIKRSLELALAGDQRLRPCGHHADLPFACNRSKASAALSWPVAKPTSWNRLDSFWADSFASAAAGRGRIRICSRRAAVCRRVRSVFLYWRPIHRSTTRIFVIAGQSPCHSWTEPLREEAAGLRASLICTSDLDVRMVCWICTVIPFAVQCCVSREMQTYDHCLI
jgi:hypothetical protein